ncbi:hypothetical protein [Nocardia terpenica]|uniref:hypothetical protein n=1 Tax=Nocardia terpenica TaxID=455432 RepID=UPI0002DFB069|nr:hypothetical protein [Nocardia terpenica]NQE87565.1 hypothetical protein [Nocardia terpenica]
MTATTPTIQCSTPNCPNPAIGTLPVHIPSDENDVVCGECLAAYWACIESDRDDYS